MREGGGNRVVEKRELQLSNASALPCHHVPSPQLLSIPRLRGKGGWTGLRREEKRRGQRQPLGAGPFGRVRTSLLPFLQTWTPQLIWDVSSLQRRQQQFLSPALWARPSLGNAGRALQKEAWGGFPAWQKPEPRDDGGGEQPKPSEVQSFPSASPSCPTWETRERTKTFYLS